MRDTFPPSLRWTLTTLFSCNRGQLPNQSFNHRMRRLATKPPLCLAGRFDEGPITAVVTQIRPRSDSSLLIDPPSTVATVQRASKPGSHRTKHRFHFHSLIQTARNNPRPSLTNCNKRVLTSYPKRATMPRTLTAPSWRRNVPFNARKVTFCNGQKNAVVCRY